VHLDQLSVDTISFPSVRFWDHRSFQLWVGQRWQP